MTNSKSTKRALLTSALALVVCVAMLIGTTFAWFTDTASTAVNKIQAGTLNIELLDKEGHSLGDDHALAWETTDEKPLWEPNCTYNLEQFQIKNAGNLALKYKVVLKATDIAKTDDGKTLLDVLDWTIKLGNETLSVTSEQIKTDLGGGIAIITDQPLMANGTDKISVTAHMKAEAGNDYQGLSIDGFGITVVATQYTYENDSNGNQYDANADYPEIQPVGTLEQLKEILGTDDINGKTVKLYDDISADTLPVSSKDVAIDLNGKSLNTKKLDVTNSTVVIKDTSESKDGAITTDSTAGVINAVNSDITIESGKFASNSSSSYARVMQIRNSNLTINGGYFENTAAGGSYNYMIDISSYNKREKSIVTINGGEFVSHKDYGYIITGYRDANADVVINGGIFKTTGSHSVLTQVTGNVVVNDCTFTAEGNNTVFDIPENSTVTVKGGTYSVNEKCYYDTSLAGLIFHRKTNGWTSVSGTLLVDPVKPVKVNQETYSGFIAPGATQSAKGADGFYTISK